MKDIDEMDVMFYFDILIYKNKRDDKENLKVYDNMGV